jgi:Tfp pilus assembly protein PilN
VNAVNLLPAKHRPRTPTGGQQGSAYVVVGILGAVLVMVVFYVLTVNGVNGNKGKVAEAKAATARAEARAAELGPYGNFSQVKEQRVQSVKQLADGRIDWERLTRGLSRVLPNNVWLLSASASASGTPAAAGGGTTTSTPPGGGPVAGADQAATGPKVQLTGCAPSQTVVATTLVRLRELAGAKDVQLNEITKPEPVASSAGAAPAGGDSDCGTLNGKSAAKWDAIVTFDAKAGTATSNVPKSLGGGA